MRIETTTRTLYTFDELTEENQQKAIDGLYDLNIDHEWWDQTYDDADMIGCKILEFDIDRGSYCKLEFVETAELAASSIVESHGKDCETYKTAVWFMGEHRQILQKEENNDPDEYNHDELMENLDEEFCKMLSGDYLKMLRADYEYLTTAEAIKETIEANEYEFTIEGQLA
jgi:hypothetical protein